MKCRNCDATATHYLRYVSRTPPRIVVDAAHMCAVHADLEPGLAVFRGVDLSVMLISSGPPLP